MSREKIHKTKTQSVPGLSLSAVIAPNAALFWVLEGSVGPGTVPGLMGPSRTPKKCGARGDKGAQSRGAGHKIADFRLDLMDLLS